MLSAALALIMSLQPIVVDTCVRYTNPLEYIVFKGVVTSEFGERFHPLTHDYKIHHGIDLAAKKGSAVRPLAYGKVVSVIRHRSYGKMIIISHGKDLVTRYLHLNKIKVKPGDEVDLDTVIGTVGTTGSSTGPHLHFEILFLEQYINPRKGAVLYSYLFNSETCGCRRKNDFKRNP